MDEIVVTIKDAKNKNEYICIRFNNKLSTTFDKDASISHWKIVNIDYKQNIIAFQSCFNRKYYINISKDNKRDAETIHIQNDLHIYNTASSHFIIKHVNKPFSIQQKLIDFKLNEQQKYIKNIVNNIAYNINGYFPHQIFNGFGLTNEQKSLFIKNGYIVIKNAISMNVVNDALGYINTGLSQGTHLNDVNNLWICQEKRILNLFFHSNLYSICKSILDNEYEIIIHAAQIALNFPLNPDVKHYIKTFNKNLIQNTQWHIDGMNIDKNGTNIGGFSLLCGIILSDWKDKYHGNFTVYEGSHHDIYKEIKKNGEQEFILKQNNKHTKTKLPHKIVQIIGKPGDIVIAHPFLAHTRGPNVSNNIRYAVFMRPTLINHPYYLASFLERNMFIEYKGISSTNNITNQHNTNDELKQDINVKKVDNECSLM